MTSTSDLISSFNVFDDKVRIVSLSFNLCFFLIEPFSYRREAVIKVYNKFWEFCPVERIKWYQTETMTRYRKVTKKILNLFPDWISSASSRTEYHIHLKDGEEYAATPDYGAWFYGIEKGSSYYNVLSNVIRFTLPAEFGCVRSDEMYNFATFICDQLNISSGVAGFCLERSDFFPRQSYLPAWQMSMQHRGLDVANELSDAIGVGQDGIKGVNWLTILSSQFVDRLGGLDKLRIDLSSSLIAQTESAVIIRACADPIIGGIALNETIAPYKSVYRVVSPLMAPIFNRYSAFSLPGGDHIAKTRAWLTRLGE